MHAPGSLRKSCGGACSQHRHAVKSHAPRLPLRSSQKHVSRGESTCTPAALPSAAIWSGVALLGAYYLSKQMELEEQDRLETTSRRPCPSCGGSGYEACMCTRWSDGDVGCNTCSQTGYMKCRSCGGRGTAIPIKVSIRKDNL